MNARNACLIVAALLGSILLTGHATAGVVDMKQSPLAQTVSVGTVVNVKIVVSSPNVGGQPWDAMDAVVTWDPTRLTLIGSTQVGAGTPFFLTGFLPDPDGVNSNLTDGNAIFTALGLPGTQIPAPPAPAELVVTTLQFLALTPTPATPVDFLPTIGVFGKTRVLLGGFSVTGDATSVAFVQIVGACPPSGHNCFTVGVPGCSDSDCCDLVCAMDPICCDTAWDLLCVASAESLCDGCGDPSAGSCCSEHGTPFCDDRACCSAICADDAFCCTTSWDDLCVEQTLGLPECGCDPCDVSNESCFAAHVTPGCNDADCCGLVCASDPSCCDTAWDVDCKESANVLCGGCGVPSSGSCYCPHANTGCDDAGCCRQVCEDDPYCCESQWDGICAGEANTLCNCPFDADLDGDVDGADLAVFLGAWGTNQCPYDVDHNGNINGADLAVFLGAWGNCP